MAQAALIASAVSSVAGGLAGASEAAAEKKRAETNAYIGRTRAIQTDTVARQGVESEIGTMRAVFGANSQEFNPATFEVMRALRDVRSRERRIEVGNRNAEAADFRMQAANAGARGRAAMFRGFAGAVQPTFSLFQLRRG